MSTNTLPKFDLIEDILTEEYEGHAGQVEHYREMADMASHPRGVQKWNHLGRIAQKMKDDTLAILYAYNERKSLRRLVEQIGEAIAERHALIKWLILRPADQSRHIARANFEVDYFTRLRFELLHTAAKRMKGAERQREAQALLAAQR